MYTIRGATTVQANTEKEILDGTEELLKLIIEENGLRDDEISAIYFTCTKDLDAAYPARSARKMDIRKAALMCLQEMYVVGSLEKCIRICFFCDGEKDQNDVKHIYIKGAAHLRPDITSGGATETMFKVIAIDGPAGAGKSTVAKRVAEKLGFTYLDTGAMYRAITYKVLKEKVDLDDEMSIFNASRSSKLDFGAGGIYLDGELVETQIRSSEVTANVSKVSAYGKVREVLVDMQREISKGKSSVVDGRDIGTVVFPKAWLKIFLTASVDERAERRYKEIGGKIPLDEIKKSIEERDYKDSNREVSPLKQADDALLLDTTGKSIDQVTAEIVKLAEER